MLFEERTVKFLLTTLTMHFIDYRCEDRKKVGELRGYPGAIREVLSPSFRKH
jgi:hypothetical protein